MKQANTPRRARGPSKLPTQRAKGYRFVGAMVPLETYRALANAARDGKTQRAIVEAALSAYLGVTR